MRWSPSLLEISSKVSKTPKNISRDELYTDLCTTGVLVPAKKPAVSSDI